MPTRWKSLSRLQQLVVKVNDFYLGLVFWFLIWLPSNFLSLGSPLSRFKGLFSDGPKTWGTNWGLSLGFLKQSGATRNPTWNSSDTKKRHKKIGKIKLTWSLCLFSHRRPDTWKLRPYFCTYKHCSPNSSLPSVCYFFSFFRIRFRVEQ